MIRSVRVEVEFHRPESPAPDHAAAFTAGGDQAAPLPDGGPQSMGFGDGSLIDLGAAWLKGWLRRKGVIVG